MCLDLDFMMIKLILLFYHFDFETTGVSEEIKNDNIAITPIPDTIKVEKPIPSLPPIKITLPISNVLKKRTKHNIK